MQVDTGSLLGLTGIFPHATRVASIFHARGDDGLAITGAAWNGRLTYWWKGDYTSPVPGQSNGIKKYAAQYAIQRAILSGARVVNLSIGLGWRQMGHIPGDTSTPQKKAQFDKDTAVVEDIANQTDIAISNAFAALDAKGKPHPLIVIAAGNDSLDLYWSGIAEAANRATTPIANEILVVGGVARDPAITRWRWSNFGRSVTVFAPAESIQADHGGGFLKWNSGTSYAAPQVAGTAGLMLSINPSLSASNLKTKLLLAADSAARSVLNPGASSGRSPTLDAYWAAKVAAQDPGTSFCGNRLWLDSTSMHVARGTTDERIALPPGLGFPLDVQPRHGGRFPGIRAFLPDGTVDIWSLVGGAWVRSSQIPSGIGNSLAGAWYSTGKLLDLGQYYPGGWDGNGWFAATHNGDTLVFADISINANTFAVSLDVTRAVGGTRTPLGGTRTVTASQPAGSAPVVMTDLSQFGQGQETLMSDVRVVSQPRVAVSPAGRYAYVAWNTTRGGMLEPDQAFFPHCVYGQSSVFPCRGGLDELVVRRRTRRAARLADGAVRQRRRE